MKTSLVIFTAVLLVCQAAKVPQEVIHQVIVPVPSSVLAAPSEAAKEIPAQIEEIAKDQVLVENVKTVIMPTEQLDAKTMNSVKVETTTMADAAIAENIKRNTRAVPFTDTAQEKSPNAQQGAVMRNAKAKPKPPSTVYKISPYRSMRSVRATENPDSSTTMPSINPCDLLCTKFEFEPICATNGLCLHEFPNQCILDTYNCKHASGKFTATKDDRCQMSWLTKCEESEIV